eukprot:CAMPEP_0197673830 /NCGR_PEP_ID=MMETSP1338-20131121/81753_1 /TAXON_ID=43686 ORGANISM="Pelagodinium beii, Strain RCC1491" /NCGR_SAMPLE_ID=MMETSP1338 /ASSEMBLY_ACC=CAM_ASM_000754 /LENGTH=110 /DNA_ID=CAMNT_0043254133 /DNA_START=144 /DNA_END=472 /DNA_ORIENTATION=+
MKTEHTLTLEMLTPPSWLVTSHAAEHDLDNIRAVDAVMRATAAGGFKLEGERPKVAATFRLSGLYLEGSAHVEGSDNSATGLQLELSRTDGAGESSETCGNADTRVMKNL